MRGGLLSLCCLLAAAGLARGVSAGPLPRASIRFEQLSLEDGLSQSSVYTMIQDGRGFLWLGTQDGLNRFDGYGFLTYRQDPEKPSGLASSYIRCLLEDRRGALWIGTDRGLSRLDPGSGSFTTFRHAEDDDTSLSHDFVYALHEDAQGALWVGTENGVNRLAAGSGSFARYHFDPLAGDRPGAHTILSLAGDPRGGLWLGTAAGLRRLDPHGAGEGELSFGRQEVPPIVFALQKDSGGRLWIGTGNGLYRLDPAAGSPERVATPTAPGAASSDGSQVRSLHEDRRGILWVGTRNGLTALDPRTGEAISFRTSSGDDTALTSDDVRSILEDGSGLLWFGTDGGGVNVYDPLRNAFRHHRSRVTRTGALADDMVLSVLEDSAARLWVGTWRGGLNVSDDGGESFRTIRAEATPGLDDDVVYALAEGGGGALWLGTEAGGLSRFDPASGRFQSFRHDPADPRSLSEDAILSLLVDSRGRLWVGTWAAGLNRCDPGTLRCERFQHRPNDPRSLSDNTIYELLEDDHGDLWVGTESGVNRLRRDATSFDRFRHDPADPTSLLGDDVMAIHQDSAGTIWLATYSGGLNRFDDSTDRFTHFTTRHGLPSNVVYGILEDDAGGLWLSTNNGLSRFDPRTGRFRSFDAGDGTLSNEFNSGAFHRSPAGRLFFGSIEGLLSFDPADLLAGGDQPPPPVAISSVRRLGRPAAPALLLSGAPAIELAHEEAVSFELAVLDYRRPKKNRFAYRLRGATDDWIDLGTKRDITLTNLAPGHHSLQVRGASSTGVWNEVGVAVEIVVARPYWATWWFRFAVLLAIVALGLALHRLRLRAVAAHNEQLQAINARLARQIARRREVEVALRDKDVELGLALAGSHTGTWSWKMPENRIGGSAEAAQILGLGDDELSGPYERFLDLVHPEDRPEVERQMRLALEAGGSYDLEHRVCWPDGSWRWIHGRGQATAEAGAIGGISGIITDVTRRKLAERERESLIELLEARNAELEQFAYTVSHDMKAPLVTIRGFLGLAERDAASRSFDRLQGDLRHIGRAAEAMTQLLQGLLRLSTVGRVESPYEPLELDRLAEEAVAVLEGTISGRGVRVELDFADSRVTGDRLRLLEVFQNLIENACKFMGGQPAPRVWVGAASQDGKMVCYVRDNGIGIASPLQSKVFDLFTRLDPTTEGTGVGLCLVKRIVEEHGGQIWVESDPPRPGSTFWFTLPAAS